MVSTGKSSIEYNSQMFRVRRETLRFLVKSIATDLLSEITNLHRERHCMMSFNVDCTRDRRLGIVIQLSQNAQSSANSACGDFTTLERSFIMTANRSGLITLPWGIPFSIAYVPDISVPIQT